MTQVYRRAASVLVLRPLPDTGTYELLLLHKPRKNDSWQLPQGGVEEGESLREAALRELREEASVEGCEVLQESALLYKYDFPPSYRRFRPDNVIGQTIGFIVALAPVGSEVTVDRNEIDDFRWIRIEELGQYIRRSEYVDLVRELYTEAMSVIEKRKA